MKKRLIGILISFFMLLTIMLGSTTASLAADAPIIKVFIPVAADSNSNYIDYTQATITMNGNYVVNGATPLANGVTYTVKLSGTTIDLCTGDGSVVFSSPDLTISSATGTDTITLVNQRPGYGTYAYRGSFRFYIVGTTLRLVNALDLETYLYGVLPYEMSETFPDHALMAQAVCARTFAAMHMSGDPNYDLDDTGAHAQVFKGFDGTKSKSIAAVDGTRGQVLKYGDSAYVNCYYSGSNGGWTEITQHRWSATEPLKAYDQIKADPYDIANPSSKQERLVLPGTITTENPIQYQNWSNGSYSPNENSPTGVDTASRYLRLCALQAVRDAGYIANVSDDIEILGFSNIVPKTYDTGSGQHHGGTTKSDGSIEYDGNDVAKKNDCKDMTQADVTMTVMANRFARSDENSGYLLGDVDRNGAISIADYTFVRLHILGRQALPNEAITIADVDRNGTVSIADYTLIRLHILGLKAIEGRTNDGVIREPVTVTFTINLTDMDVGAAYQSFFVSSLGLFTVDYDDTNWYIYQRRYGHGIGLSQRGAQQRAKSVEEGGGGQTYDQILDFYFSNCSEYPAVTLKTMY